jgi:hypothetical protein
MLWERATAAEAMVAIAVMAVTMPAVKSPTNLFSLTNNDFISLTTCSPHGYHGAVRFVGTKI